MKSHASYPSHILADDEGNPIPGAQELVYRLEGELETLDQIEQATEKFKQQALPEIEHSLLAGAQERFITDRGEKHNLLPLLRFNGKERVWIKTIHGSFEFAQNSDSSYLSALAAATSSERDKASTARGSRSSVCTTATASVSPK